MQSLNLDELFTLPSKMYSAGKGGGSREYLCVSQLSVVFSVVKCDCSFLLENEMHTLKFCYALGLNREQNCQIFLYISDIKMVQANN